MKDLSIRTQNALYQQNNGCSERFDINTFISVCPDLLHVHFCLSWSQIADTDTCLFLYVLITKKIISIRKHLSIRTQYQWTMAAQKDLMSTHVHFSNLDYWVMRKFHMWQQSHQMVRGNNPSGFGLCGWPCLTLPLLWQSTGTDRCIGKGCWHSWTFISTSKTKVVSVMQEKEWYNSMEKTLKM